MINIIFSDENILICEKPVGICSQSNGSDDMVSLLSRQTDNDIFPVHRLDTGVGGIMIFAKNKKTAADLSSQIANGIFKKRYLAVVKGCPEENKGIYKDLLFKDSRKNKSFVVKRMRKGVKEAELEYEVLAEGDDCSLVKILLHTGRTHQIRVQFSSRKMPLLGDGKYGSTVNCPIALWSHSLEFNYKNERKYFELNPDFCTGVWSRFSF